MVKLNDVAPLSGMLPAPNTFDIVGGDATVMLAMRGVTRAALY